MGRGDALTVSVIKFSVTGRDISLTREFADKMTGSQQRRRVHFSPDE